MRIDDVMTRDVRTCALDDSLSRAAQIMWDADCGCVPVVDDEGRPIAMVTDRDVCMAAYTRGESLASVRVASCCSRHLVTVRADERLAVAEQLMRAHRIRRLPVVDASGKLVGLLSMNDVVRRGLGDHPRDISAEGIVKTLAAVCSPRAARVP